MKSLFFLFLILILLPFVSSVSVTMNSEFAQGETMIAEISGNFIQPLQASNINFYSGYERIPVDFSLKKIEDNYYLYAQLFGKSPGEYSLKFEDVQYQIINSVYEEDIVHNFTITNSTADFYIEPGIIVTEGNFALELQNLKSSEQVINIENFLDEAREITLPSLSSEQAFFNISDINETSLNKISFSTDQTSYEVPVYVIIDSEKNSSENTQRSYLFSPPSLEVEMATNSEAQRIVYLYNDGEQDLENIEFIVSDSIKPYINLSTDFINSLEKNQSISITLYFNSSDENKTIEGDIRANSSSLYAYLGILLDFIPGYVPVEETESIDPSTNPSVLETCEELEGSICEEEQDCSEETIPAKDGNCCLAECQDSESQNPKTKIVGWVIIIAIVLGLIVFYKKKFGK